MRRGWSDADIAKLAGGNILRVTAAAEDVACRMRSLPPAVGVEAILDGPA